MAAFETPVGSFRMVGIHGLGSGASGEWPPLRSTQPGHAKELFFNKGVQGFGGAVRSLQGISFLQGISSIGFSIWEDFLI